MASRRAGGDIWLVRLPPPVRTGLLTLGWAGLALTLGGPAFLLHAWIVLVLCTGAGAIVAGRVRGPRLSLAFFVLFLEQLLFLVLIALVIEEEEVAAWLPFGVAALQSGIAALNLELVGRIAPGEGRPWCRRPFRWAALGGAWVVWFSAAGVLPQAAPPVPRMDFAHNLFSELRSRYPHWASSRITPDRLWEKHEALIESASGECPEDPTVSCGPFLEAVHEMLADLGNGHTNLVIEKALAAPLVHVRGIGGEAVIVRVAEDSDAHRSGLRAGDVITAVDGRPVAEALAAVPATDLGYASPRTRDLRRYESLLDGLTGSTVSVTVRSPAGGETTRTLVRSNEYVFSDDAAERSLWPLWLHREGPDFQVSQDGPRIRTLTFDNFTGRQFEAQLDRALRETDDPPGIILDLRSNPGGYLHHTVSLLSRFLTEPTRIGLECAAMDGETVVDCQEIVVEPDDPYRGPLAVLINERTFSAAELAAVALCRSGRARAFGVPTAGETDFCEDFELPGGNGSFAVGSFEPAWGESIYGVGLVPDVLVERTQEAARQGLDPTAVEAYTWLREQVQQARAAGVPAPPTSSGDRGSSPAAGRRANRSPRARG